MIDVIVKLNGERRKASAVFAPLNDLTFINGWRDKLGDDPNIKRQDALEMAELAIHNAEAHSRLKQIYVTSTEEIGKHIDDDRHVELGALVQLKCDWFPDSGVIGVCHFRRSWSNSLVLDYLAVHPFIADIPDDYEHKVKGAGSALLWFISDIARRYACSRIWGEATHGSHRFYKRIFYLETVEDLIVIPPLNYLECVKNDLRWLPEGETNKMKAEIVDELYEAEAENPPLIGRRSLVVSPLRTLTYHFLQLTTPIQLQIAKLFGLPGEGQEKLRDENLFRILYQRATETGKLGDLWKEVESKHPKGRPDEIPFG